MAIVQKTNFVFEVTKGENNERVYQFIIPSGAFPQGAPYGELFDVALEMLVAAEQYSKDVVENIKKARDEAKANEEAANASVAQEVTAEVQ